MNRITTHRHVLKLEEGVSIEAETTEAESPFKVEERCDRKTGLVVGVSVPISDIEDQLLAQGVPITTTWSVS